MLLLRVSSTCTRSMWVTPSLRKPGRIPNKTIINDEIKYNRDPAISALGIKYHVYIIQYYFINLYRFGFVWLVSLFFPCHTVLVRPLVCKGDGFLSFPHITTMFIYSVHERTNPIRDHIVHIWELKLYSINYFYSNHSPKGKLRYCYLYIYM